MPFLLLPAPCIIHQSKMFVVARWTPLTLIHLTLYLNVGVCVCVCALPVARIYASAGRGRLALRPACKFYVLITSLWHASGAYFMPIALPCFRPIQATSFRASPHLLSVCSCHLLHLRLRLELCCHFCLPRGIRFVFVFIYFLWIWR